MKSSVSWKASRNASLSVHSSSEQLQKRLSGNLTLTNISSLPHCVNVQVRGADRLLTTSEAKEYLSNHQQQQHRQQQNNKDTSLALSMGVIVVEDPDSFVSLSKGNFHLFHFLEFAVIAFAEHYRLTTTASSSSSTLSSSLPLSVQWWYAPLLTRREICGTAGGMNCRIMQMLWPTLSTIHGLESNSMALQEQHQAYAGVLYKRAKVGDEYTPDDKQQARHDHMVNQVDVLLLIDRVQCKNEQQKRIHKIWTNYLDSFPAQAWHEAIMRALEQFKVSNTVSQAALEENENAQQSYLLSSTNAPQQPQEQEKLVVCYIDRQSTNRNLPPDFHTWLLQYLRRHGAVELRHLRMERYSAVAQMALATQCDALLGGHGNGLSHLLWMHPGQGVVLELYWDFSFHYDYASAAQLLGHSYRGVYNGQLLDTKRILARDNKMLSCCTTSWPRELSHWNMTASQEVVRDFVETALIQKGVKVQ